MKKTLEENKLFIILLILFLIFSFYKTRNKNDLLLLTEDTSLSQAANLEEQEEEEAEKEKKIFVHLAGDVLRPGVYQLYEGARLEDLIEEAGVRNLELLNKYFNRAQVLSDGMKIYIPSSDELTGEEEFALLPENISSFSESAAASSSKLVDINRSTKEELMTLPGIGQTKAQDIINYREKNGNFKMIDDIMLVKGIGPATFEKLKDLIKT